MTRWTPDSQNEGSLWPIQQKMCENRRGISEATKIKVYRAVVSLPPSFMAVKRGKTYQWQINKLKPTFTRPVRGRFSASHCKNTSQNIEVLNSGFSSQHLHHLDATTASLVWSCCLHEKITTSRRKLDNSELSQGKRCQGSQKKRFKGTHWRFSMKSFRYHPYMSGISGRRTENTWR